MSSTKKRSRVDALVDMRDLMKVDEVSSKLAHYPWCGTFLINEITGNTALAMPFSIKY